MTLATPPQPPPTPAPTPAPEPRLSLESWLRPAHIVWLIIFGTLTIGGNALASYFGATGELRRIGERQDQTSAGLAQLRIETDRQIREYRAAVDARLEALERAQAAAERQMAVLEERLRTMTGTIDRMDRRQEVLLDRLNAPRVRTVRDFPQ